MSHSLLDSTPSISLVLHTSAGLRVVIRLLVQTPDCLLTPQKTKKYLKERRGDAERRRRVGVASTYLKKNQTKVRNVKNLRQKGNLDGGMVVGKNTSYPGSFR